MVSEVLAGQLSWIHASLLARRQHTRQASIAVAHTEGIQLPEAHAMKTAYGTHPQSAHTAGEQLSLLALLRCVQSMLCVDDFNQVWNGLELLSSALQAGKKPKYCQYPQHLHSEIIQSEVLAMPGNVSSWQSQSTQGQCCPTPPRQHLVHVWIGSHAGTTARCRRCRSAQHACSAAARQQVQARPPQPATKSSSVEQMLDVSLPRPRQLGVQDREPPCCADFHFARRPCLVAVPTAACRRLMQPGASSARRLTHPACRLSRSSGRCRR